MRRTARTEMNALEKAGVIKKKKVFRESEKTGKKIRVEVFVLNRSFEELQALQSFLFETAPINGETLKKHLGKAGKIEFLVMTGVFVRDFEHRIDFMVAMKKLDQSKLENAVRALEAELGIEIRFAAFTTTDLQYRVGMNDKLIRDIFDYTHDVVVNKAGITFQTR